MLINVSLTTLLARLRAVTDKESDTSLDDTLHSTPWLNEAIRELWGRMAPLARDELTTLVAFTIASGQSTYTIAPTDVLSVRGVGVDYAGNGRYVRIRPWKWHQRGAVSRLSYRWRGATGAGATGVIEIQPQEWASQYPYQLAYVREPALLAAGIDTIDLPLGADTYVLAHAAQQVRIRFKEDPTPHAQLLEAQWRTIRTWLQQHGQGEASAPADWTDDGAEFWP